MSECLDYFNRYLDHERKSLITLAKKNVKYTDVAEDIVQEVIINLSQKYMDPSSKIHLYFNSRHQNYKVLTNYINKSIWNKCIDYQRKIKREKKALIQKSEAINFFSDKEITSISDLNLSTPEIYSFIEYLPKKQQIDMSLYLGEKHSYSEISQLTNRKQATIRKSISEGKDNLFAHYIYTLIRNGATTELNKPRITDLQAKKVASIIRGDDEALDMLFHIFSYKDLNRAIQNATWILINLYSNKSKKGMFIGDFLEEQLIRGNLFRGNKNYISEALIEFNYRKYIYKVCNSFIRCMNEFEDRIKTNDFELLNRHEVNERCIYDVKRVRNIGLELKSRDLESLRLRYMSGEGSIDERRGLAFQLMRCHSSDLRYINSVVDSLNDEIDQTNAYYVIKYLQRWGVKDHPHIFNQQLLSAVQKVQQRFPYNQFISKTFMNFKKKFSY